MRTPLIAGNWKMHHGVAETQVFLETLVTQDVPATVDVVVCPPFVSLPVAAMVTTGSEIALGAQNVHWESSGAFTGEVSAEMLIERHLQDNGDWPNRHLWPPPTWICLTLSTALCYRAWTTCRRTPAFRSGSPP